MSLVFSFLIQADSYHPSDDSLMTHPMTHRKLQNLMVEAVEPPPHGVADYAFFVSRKLNSAENPKVPKLITCPANQTVETIPVLKFL